MARNYYISTGLKLQINRIIECLVSFTQPSVFKLHPHMLHNQEIISFIAERLRLYEYTTGGLFIC